MDRLTHEVEETQLKLATKEEMLSSMEQSNCQLQGEVEHLSMTVKSSDKKFVFVTQLLTLVLYIIHVGLNFAKNN